MSRNVINEKMEIAKECISKNIKTLLKIYQREYKNNISLARQETYNAFNEICDFEKINIRKDLSMYSCSILNAAIQDLLDTLTKDYFDLLDSFEKQILHCNKNILSPINQYQPENDIIKYTIDMYELCFNSSAYQYAIEIGFYKKIYVYLKNKDGQFLKNCVKLRDTILSEIKKEISNDKFYAKDKLEGLKTALEFVENYVISEDYTMKYF
ncbi:MAG: hypothetical protein WC942_08650 [Clostridia bacterium]|jgi:hypothetical protein